MMYKQFSQSGFSLVETLVAITILLIVITGPLTIITSTSRSTSFSSEQVIAFFLAQEGNELAQRARDDILLQGPVAAGSDPNPWDTFTSAGGPYSTCFSVNGCGLELNTDLNGTLKAPVSCSSGGCRLYYDSSATDNRQRYTYVSAGNDETPFTRIVTFENIGAGSPYEMRVVSTVRWRTGSLSAEQEVSVETFLFDVYGN